jgi:hypothetical protein
MDDSIRDEIELIYGLLWDLEINKATPSGRAVSRARATALSMIDKDGQARGIQAARANMANAATTFALGELTMHSREMEAEKFVRNTVKC